MVRSTVGSHKRGLRASFASSSTAVPSVQHGSTMARSSTSNALLNKPTDPPPLETTRVDFQDEDVNTPGGRDFAH